MDVRYRIQLEEEISDKDFQVSIHRFLADAVKSGDVVSWAPVAFKLPGPTETEESEEAWKTLAVSWLMDSLRQLDLVPNGSKSVRSRVRRRMKEGVDKIADRARRSLEPSTAEKHCPACSDEGLGKADHGWAHTYKRPQCQAPALGVPASKVPLYTPMVESQSLADVFDLDAAEVWVKPKDCNCIHRGHLFETHTPDDSIACSKCRGRWSKVLKEKTHLSDIIDRNVEPKHLRSIILKKDLAGLVDVAQDMAVEVDDQHLLPPQAVKCLDAVVSALVLIARPIVTAPSVDPEAHIGGGCSQSDACHSVATHIVGEGEYCEWHALEQLVDIEAAREVKAPSLEFVKGIYDSGQIMLDTLSAAGLSLMAGEEWGDVKDAAEDLRKALTAAPAPEGETTVDFVVKRLSEIIGYSAPEVVNLHLNRLIEDLTSEDRG